MEVEFAKSGKGLIASIDCGNEPGLLDSGGVGWYEVRETDWRLGWHLRAEVSITITNEPYGGSWNGYLDVAVLDRDMLQLVFPIPDIIRPFKKSGWGGVDGGPITIRSVRYHCQARVRACAPKDGSYLERVGENLRFCRSIGSDAEPLLVLKNSLPSAPDRLRKLLEKHPESDRG